MVAIAITAAAVALGGLVLTWRLASLPVVTPIDIVGGAPDDLDIAISECERRARQAQVVFEPTKTMQVGRVEKFTIRASVAGDPPQVDGATNTTIEDLIVHCELQAALRGAQFDIDPAGFRVRSFLDGPTVSWTWDVAPKEQGNLMLTLEVQSLVRDRTGEVDEFTTDVLVEAEDRSFMETLNDAIVAFVEHPLVKGVGLVGLGGAVAKAFGYVRSRRRAVRNP